MTDLRQFYMRIVDTDDFKNFIEPHDLSRQNYIEWVEDEVKRIRRVEEQKL